MSSTFALRASADKLRPCIEVCVICVICGPGTEVCVICVICGPGTEVCVICVICGPGTEVCVICGPAADARRGLSVRVLDGRGRATLAGAEVRAFAAGSSRLVGARIVDSGSGYDAQNDMPVHFGVPSGTARVDVQVIVPHGGKRTITWQRGVAPGKPITIRAQ